MGTHTPGFESAEVKCLYDVKYDTKVINIILTVSICMVTFKHWCSTSCTLGVHTRSFIRQSYKLDVSGFTKGFTLRLYTRWNNKFWTLKMERAV